MNGTNLEKRIISVEDIQLNILEQQTINGITCILIVDKYGEDTQKIQEQCSQAEKLD